MPPVIPMPVRSWATPDVAVYKYAEDRDWDEYVVRQPVPKSARPSTTKSNKRTADAAGVEPPKKRRKDEPQQSMPAPSPAVVPPPAKRAVADAHRAVEERPPAPASPSSIRFRQGLMFVQTDLSSLPTSSLMSYLVKHDIIPPIHPSPYTPQPTLAPSILLNPPSHTPPPPVLPPPTAPAGTEPERRRSSRFQDEDTPDQDAHHVPILTDLDGLHGVMAKLVERHWQTKTVREQDTIAGFVWCAQRARERTLLAASSAGHS
ncbi:hypothetical protein RhiLY_11695 [Ceratobasidium sp. AG-Ba]|nr:hypothetical protein RhiLY_11695 [Ceratobasidium sp. AG-Ba]